MRKRAHKMPMMIAATVDLYRVGSLGKLRDADVVVFAGATDPEIRVHGLPWMSTPGQNARPSRGVSCYGSHAGASVLNGKVRHMPAGSLYDDALLTLWPDYPGSDHWSWSPAVDMSGSDFLNALRAVDALFT
jgi:hypothetical protein